MWTSLRMHHAETVCKTRATPIATNDDKAPRDSIVSEHRLLLFLYHQRRSSPSWPCSKSSEMATMLKYFQQRCVVVNTRLHTT